MAYLDNYRNHWIYRYRFEARETMNVPEKSRMPPIGISLAETPASQYPHRVGKTSNERNREAPENLEHMMFTV